MILVLLLYSFLWTERLDTILQPLAKKIFILDGLKRTLVQKSLSSWNIVLSVVSEMLQFLEDIDDETLLLAHLSLIDSPYKIEVDFTFDKTEGFTRLMIFAQEWHLSNNLHAFFFTFTGCNHILIFWHRWKVWCQNAYITKTFTKLSWTPDKVKEKDFNYVCAAYDPHNRFHMNDVNRLRFLLFRKSSDYKLRKLSPTKKALQLHILLSAYAVRLIWAVTYNQVIKCHLRLTGNGSTPRAIGLLWIGADDMMLMTTCWCKWIHTYLHLQRILLSMQVCEERSIMSSVLQLHLYCNKIKYCWIVYLYIYRGVFRTQLNIYDGAFLRE